jgi:type VI secretion system protein ImpJ
VGCSGAEARRDPLVGKALNMANSEVHWHEGMFLRQHHFLTARQQMLRVLRLEVKWDLHHNWGLRSIQLNTDALANFRFAVSSIKARLRDGTSIEVPEDGPLPDLDLKPLLERHRKVTVFLGIPLLGSGRSNVSVDGPKDEARYYLATRSLEDENTGVNPQTITVRMLNLKLLLATSSQNLPGYETLPIARVEKSERAEATPQLDKTYFPPLLACDAWHDLQVGLLQNVYDRVGRKIEKLAKQAVTRGLSMEGRGQGDYLVFAQLRELNEAYATLRNLVFLEGVHPLASYQELCRLVGQLSVFDPSRRPPEIPLYNHDDLGGCFYRVKQYLDDLLSIVPEPDYQERPFIGNGLRMQVALERAWLESNSQIYIGVHSSLEPDDCVKLMMPGALDMKVGSSETVETIFRLGGKGLLFAHAPTPPQAFPRERGLTYFQIDPQTNRGEWEQVERTLTLAVRFNERLVTGNIDRQRDLSLRYGGMETTLRFTLYVGARSAAASTTAGNSP